MFNGIIYNQGIIKNIKRSTKYVKGSLVIEVSSDIKFKKRYWKSLSAAMGCLTLIKLKKNPFILLIKTINRSNFKYTRLVN